MNISKRGYKPCNGDGLTSKVFPFHLCKDNGGEFIGYCDYDAHKGIVLRPEVCETRRCSHYYKFYTTGNNFFPRRREEPTVTRLPYRVYVQGKNGNHQ